MDANKLFGNTWVYPDDHLKKHTHYTFGQDIIDFFKQDIRSVTFKYAASINNAPIKSIPDIKTVRVSLGATIIVKTREYYNLDKYNRKMQELRTLLNLITSNNDYPRDFLPAVEPPKKVQKIFHELEKSEI